MERALVSCMALNDIFNDLKITGADLKACTGPGGLQLESA